MKNIIRKFNKSSIAVLGAAFTLGIAGLLIVTTTTSNFVAVAATSVNLGSADNFTVLAATAITNTGSSVINGNLGISPNSAVTGFPPGTINGTQEVANSTAAQAKTDLITAYNNAAGQTPVSTIPTELGGTTKTAGVYDSASGTFQITNSLTLDAAGDPSAVFIFKTNSTLITAGASNIVLTNGAQACNIFWQVGSSATIGTNSIFKGNILALTSATLTTGANVEGRVLVRNGAITLDSNIITRATCATPTSSSSSSSTVSSSSTSSSISSSNSTVSSTPTSIPSSSSNSSSTPSPSSTSSSTVSSALISNSSSSTFSSNSSSTSNSTSSLKTSPKLPNAGIDPEDKSNTLTWSFIITAGIFATLLSFYLVKRKQPK